MGALETELNKKSVGQEDNAATVGGLREESQDNGDDARNRDSLENEIRRVVSVWHAASMTLYRTDPYANDLIMAFRRNNGTIDKFNLAIPSDARYERGEVRWQGTLEEADIRELLDLVYPTSGAQRAAKVEREAVTEREPPARSSLRMLLEGKRGAVWSSVIITQRAPYYEAFQQAIGNMNVVRVVHFLGCPDSVFLAHIV